MCESDSGTADICDWSDSARRRGGGGARLSDSCSDSALLVPGDLHVDADGGCGLVRGPSQSVCYKAEKIHSLFLHLQLW